MMDRTSALIDGAYRALLRLFLRAHYAKQDLIVIPEPKCLVCGHALERLETPASYECPRCGFLIAQHTIEKLTRDQDNGPS